MASKYWLVVCTVVAVACLTSFKPFKKEELKLSAHVIKHETIESLDFYTVATKLTNLSSDTIKFMTMSCSYPMEYSINVKEVLFDFHGCDKNITEIIAIPPYKDFERQIRLKTKKYAGEVKLGIGLTRIENIEDSLLAKKKKLFWFESTNYHVAAVDTSYKKKTKFMAILIDGNIEKFETMANVNFIWSNGFNLK